MKFIERFNMEKLFIQNRQGQKLAMIVDRPESPIGLAVVMHGLGGFKEQPHIEALAKVALENNYTTVRFDTTNSFGESDGQYEDVTATKSFQDLEDVIAWAKTQDWYQEPFVLVGHSLGAMCVALYAEANPAEVKALAPISTVVTGAFTFTTGKYQTILPEWKKTGWLISESFSKPGTIKRLKYDFYEDAIKFDLLPEVSKLTMPVLLVVGDHDESTPPEHEQILFDRLPRPKELHLVKGADHNFRQPEHLAELVQIFSEWLKKI